MKYKIGEMYIIYFWDHCRGSEDLIPCEMVGRLTKITKKSVTLSPWTCLDSSIETMMANSEPYTIASEIILRKEIIKAIPLKKLIKEFNVK